MRNLSGTSCGPPQPNCMYAHFDGVISVKVGVYFFAQMYEQMYEQLNEYDHCLSFVQHFQNSGLRKYK
jgi:hypothetical protein